MTPSSSSSRSRGFSPSSSRSHTPTQSLRDLELSDLAREGSGSGTGLNPNSEGDINTEPGFLGKKGRSATITSLGGFDFEHALLPLTLSGEDEVNGGTAGMTGERAEERHVGLLHGIALVVGAQVGSGIFSSPGVVVGEVGSVGASLLVWVMSGVLAWTGASSFAELGCAIPLSGGTQAYLAYAFGPMTSYLFTWTAVSLLKPGSEAMIALIFGEYINRLIVHSFSSAEEPTTPEWSIKVTALLALLLVSILNLVSRTSGTDSTLVLTTIKIGSLLFVAILGVIALVKDGPGPGLTQGLFEGTKTELSAYAIALYSGLWAFDGWDSCCFVAGEMRNTSRDLPRAVHGSMSIVLTLFVSANIAYFVVLSPAVVAASNTVALDYGKATIGSLGMVVFSVLVAISCFGALNGGFYTNARLIYAASREHFLPSVFSKLHHRRRTPDNAIFLQVALASVFVVVGGGFRAILNFVSVASWTFYLLTVLGLLVLRVKEPHLDRPYRTWLITPIVFCLVASFLMLMPIFAAPIEAIAAFIFIGAGIPMYYLTARSYSDPGRGLTKSSAGEEGGFKATVQNAWIMFREDLDEILPAKWQSNSIRARSAGRPVAAADNREERRGMLRETLEMSER
ncbi:L-methionine transporter [Kwoniella heveanensis BCC8398]|uniref:L-methionine transporter n=1 Tax=Kwoniella heveanensis BCC8398 TaxID=1296120 RepID=A0A1B9GZY9_9TREE|nr:L-methionine transporter [Kwoniella heveanensis BCC8398]